MTNNIANDTKRIVSVRSNGFEIKNVRGENGFGLEINRQRNNTRNGVPVKSHSCPVRHFYRLPRQTDFIVPYFFHENNNNTLCTEWLSGTCVGPFEKSRVFHSIGLCYLYRNNISVHVDILSTDEANAKYQRRIRMKNKINK